MKKISHDEFVTLLARRLNADAAATEERLSDFLETLDQTLKKEGVVEFPEFGKFRITEGKTVFEPALEPSLEINYRYAGMEPIEIMPAHAGKLQKLKSGSRENPFVPVEPGKQSESDTDEAEKTEDLTASGESQPEKAEKETDEIKSPADDITDPAEDSREEDDNAGRLLPDEESAADSNEDPFDLEASDAERGLDRHALQSQESETAGTGESGPEAERDSEPDADDRAAGQEDPFAGEAFDLKPGASEPEEASGNDAGARDEKTENLEAGKSEGDDDPFDLGPLYKNTGQPFDLDEDDEKPGSIASKSGESELEGGKLTGQEAQASDQDKDNVKKLFAGADEESGFDPLAGQEEASASGPVAEEQDELEKTPTTGEDEKTQQPDTVETADQSTGSAMQPPDPMNEGGEPDEVKFDLPEPDSGTEDAEASAGETNDSEASKQEPAETGSVKSEADEAAGDKPEEVAESVTLTEGTGEISSDQPEEIEYVQSVAETEADEKREKLTPAERAALRRRRSGRINAILGFTMMAAVLVIALFIYLSELDSPLDFIGRESSVEIETIMLPELDEAQLQEYELMSEAEASDPSAAGDVAAADGQLYGLFGEIQDISNPYTIVVHSLPNYRMASEERDRLRQDGFRATLNRISLPDGGETWRVGLGQFATIEDAGRAIDRLDEPYINNNFIARIR